MYVKKIELRGEGKESASLSFGKGLNLIAGASNTGKSYVVDCFKFIFGATEVPKQIKEANGYSRLEVTFSSNKGDFRLSRELKEGAKVLLSNLSNGEKDIELNPRHATKNNLSNFFLQQIGLASKVLVKGVESLGHSALTLRIFEKIFLVDEARIISKESPLGTGQRSEQTLEASLLKTILTGNDDSEVKNIKQKKADLDKITARVDYLNEFLSKYFSLESEISVNSEDLQEQLDNYENAYLQADIYFKQILESQLECTRNRQNAFKELKHELSLKEEEAILHSRFSLLMEKYQSDKERLEANVEAAEAISSFESLNCPTCGNELGTEDSVDASAVKIGNSAEIVKLKQLATDLQLTLNELSESIKKRTTKILDLEQIVSSYDESLSGEISEEVNKYKTLIQDISSSKAKLEIDLEKVTKREEIVNEIELLEEELTNIPTYKIPDHKDELEALITEISKILVRWDFPGAKNIEYDYDKRDISILGDPRENLGKGFRAIAFSAFIIGLMEHLTSKGRHPGFVILDSPLTTYKQKDESELSEEDKEDFFATNNLIYAFYRDLADSYNDKQLIVFDNEEPDDDLKPLMNYVHFSGNPEMGRSGFFPSVESL